MARKTFNWRNILNLVAFVAICFIGIALAISKIGASSLAISFKQIAEILAYVVTAVSAFFFAHSKRHWAFYLTWAICVTLIVVLMII